VTVAARRLSVDEHSLRPGLAVNLQYGVELPFAIELEILLEVGLCARLRASHLLSTLLIGDGALIGNRVIEPLSRGQMIANWIVKTH
jgi:hypothetical protein